MPAFWLTYKPLDRSSPRGWPASKLSELVASFEASPSNTTALWRFSSHRAGKPGDRVYLFKQGNDPKGIFGVGEIIENPRRQTDPTDIDAGEVYRAKIRFNGLVDPSRKFLLGFDEIRDIIPDTLEGSQSSGVSVSETVAAELEKRLAPLLSPTPPIGSEQADDDGFDPESVEDQRERALRAIRVRRGQPAFRAKLIEAYDRRCAITGCAVEAVLEAAHIYPYRGGPTNHTSNGLLLRTDLHTLFDCGLLAIDPKARTIVVADALQASSYGKFAGKKIREPKDPANGPSRLNLERRFADFEALHRMPSGITAT